MLLKRLWAGLLGAFLSGASDLYSCPVPDLPPRAALIQITAPDAAGDVIVTGAPGTVPPSRIVILVTLDTGHLTHASAGSDGSFRATLFAPGGTSILIKAADPAQVLGRIPNQGLVQIDFILHCLPGTILHVPAPAGSGEEISFAGAGVLGIGLGNTPALPPWTIQGTLSARALQPGDTLRASATFALVSSVLQAGSAMRVFVRLELERLSGPDGFGSQAHNVFASTILTPTGFPVERKPQSKERGSPFPITVVGEGRAESLIDILLRVPDEALAGYYRPVLVLDFENVPTETPTRPVTQVGLRVPFNSRAEPVGLYLPVIRVGDPASPRLFWMLLVDDLSNGTRGVRALEDQNRFGLASRILTQSEAFIIPRSDPLSGSPLTYRLEPFAPIISVGDRGQPPNPPLIPFRFPSGQLTVRVRRPDGSESVHGPAPFVQSRMKGLVDRQGRPLSQGGGNISDAYQLSTMDPRFEVQFTQDGLHVFTVEGTVEDVWGNTWRGGGTYEVYVARPLSLDTTVLPGTPFEVGDALHPGLLLTPPVPALVDVRFRLAPNSDSGRMIERRVQGQANRFGYFHPAGQAIPLEQPGEYRVDVVASYRDGQGNLWMGSRTWGGVVAPPNPAIIAHGRRGIDQQQGIGPQWFFRTQTGVPVGTTHVHMPFHSGDVAWLQESDAMVPPMTFQDLTGSFVNALRNRGFRFGSVDSRSSVGEVPLFSSRPGGLDPHLDPGRVDLWGYGYVSIQRPLVRVREEVAEPDSIFNLYWRFSDRYHDQFGVGVNGDLENEIKFQYGAAVVRGPAVDGSHYAIYGSLFVLVPENDPGGGTRVFPPFQGNGGGPSGGPIMKLKGRDIDLFIHLTGVRPGSVLETGNTFALAGAVGPPLPVQVSYTITAPSGQQRQFSGRANKVGYYYRPDHDFAIQEPGIYTVDLQVTFNGQTSAGQVTAPFPTGDVLGSANGRFYFYAVSRNAPPLNVSLSESAQLRSPWALDLQGSGLSVAHVTTMMPGFLLESRDLTLSGGGFRYRYDPVTLARDFPNLDVSPQPADAVTINLFGTASSAEGRPNYAARVIALHGIDILNPPQAVVTPSPSALVNGASFAAGAPVAPGSIASLFGTNLGSPATTAVSVPLPTTLAGVATRLNDIAAPLFFASPSQVNLQVPWELAGQTQATLTAASGDAASSPLTVSLASPAPAIFTVGSSGQGAILIAATSSIAAPEGSLPGARPVRRGEFLSIFCTGLGQVTNQPPTGAPAPSNPPATTTTMPTVTLGGVPAEVRFSGLAPGFVGLYQVNVEVPSNAPSGDRVSVVLTIGGAASNTVAVAIQP